MALDDRPGNMHQDAEGLRAFMSVAPNPEVAIGYGHARIRPSSPVVAGHYGTWQITYEVGEYGIDCFGAVALLFLSSSDWELPQLENSDASGYTSISHNGDQNVKLVSSFDPVGGIRPFSRRLLIRVTDGSLAHGDEIVITLGDHRYGSPGSRAQSFSGEVEFKIRVDPFATGIFENVSSPKLAVTPGHARSISITGPSDVVIGEPARLTVRICDEWGNLTRYSGEIAVSDARTLTSYFLTPEDNGVHQFDEICLDKTGIHRLKVTTACGLAATSNPIRCWDRQPKNLLLWGDTQSQSGETVGNGTLDDFFKYASSVAGIDFVVHSANDFQISNPLWEQIREANERYYVPGKFVTLLGYEWSGNTSTGGDHSVIFAGGFSTLHRSSHAQVTDLADLADDRNPVSDLFAEFSKRNDAIAIPHIGGRRANLDFVREDVVPAIEIVSCHGHFEWFAREAIRRELKVGFVGATDDHSGRPGASFPCNNDLRVKGGLTGLYARGRTRQDVWNAIRSRHCYATTGARIILEVSSAGALMGDELSGNEPFHISIDATGTAAIEVVEIFRGQQLQYVNRVSPFTDKVRFSWSGARTRTRGRVTNWDGYLRLSEGKFRSATKWAFDRPLDEVWLESDQCVRWTSSTVGDADGVILDLDAPPTTLLHLDAGPAKIDVPLSVIRTDFPKVWDLGGVEQAVTADWAPASDGPRNVTCAWLDESPQPGLNFYWVRIRQVDGETAWSSPIIYNYRTEP